MIKTGLLSVSLAFFFSAALAQPTFQSAPSSRTASAAEAPRIMPDYRLGPYDKISVKVFGEEKLSVEHVQIDAGGVIVLPLIGPVVAGGKTSTELSQDVEARLGERYLQSPHVSILIEEAVSQRIAVTGAVMESGVFALKGRTTLMQAIAMAKGPDIKYANLSEVAVFRQIDGRNAVGVFDLKAIRAGKAQDPDVYGGDSIVVSSSKSKTFWRELVGVLPGIGAFAFF